MGQGCFYMEEKDEENWIKNDGGHYSLQKSTTTLTFFTRSKPLIALALSSALQNLFSFSITDTDIQRQRDRDSVSVILSTQIAH